MPLKNDRVTVRDARIDDVETVHQIYAAHVLTGLASFEEVPPDLDEMAQRMRDTQAHGLPYLVSTMIQGDGQNVVQGFAYASPFRTRSAYRYTIEDSVYVASDAIGSGHGSALLGDLINRCTAMGYRQMIAVIGDTANAASIGLHAHHGFVETGSMPAVGFKFGRWVDSVRMQRTLGTGSSTPPDDFRA
ncbi:MAG: N-acetyltransferase [Alphaproteobacteria bacterium]|jgi:L-amino acid N-acyltransferase YncA|nr:N-acetyltransferase [Alphaproteobacteria bacterium]